MNRQIEEIKVVTAGSWEERENDSFNLGLLLVVVLQNQRILLHNQSLMKVHQVSFPQLFISDLSEYRGELKEELESLPPGFWQTQILRKASIIRDRLKRDYQGDRWVWTFDVGTRLTFDHRELLIFAKDSSLGVMEFWVGENVQWIDDPEQRIDFYSFAPGELKGIEREEIILGS